MADTLFLPGFLAQNRDSALAQAPPAEPPYALVVLDRSQSGIERELTYAVPAELKSTLRVGFSVLVPVARNYLTGYVIGFTDDLDFEPKNLRLIVRATSRVPLFDAKSLKLAHWMSAYYHCSLAECIGCCVPQGCQQESEKRYTFAAEEWESALRPLLRSPRAMQVAQHLLKAGASLSQRDIEKTLGLSKLGEILKKLVAAGVAVEEDEMLDPSIKPRRVQAVQAAPRENVSDEVLAQLQKAAPKQFFALKKLWELQVPRENPAREFASQNATTSGLADATKNQKVRPNSGVLFATARLAHDFGIELAALRALEKKELVTFGILEVQRVPVAHLPPRDSHAVELTREQQSAIAVIRAEMHAEKSSKVVVLHGVTASGKTEVYLHAIEECLRLGRRALVLVPEIALTAQTVEIFQRRFQERVAILHSALGAGERFDEWRRARAGRADIVVGARSAIFAPFRNIGLIVIDEEHDGSYKQDQTPRYHARDVALKRAALENAVVVLGSATPSLESFQRASRGEWAHARMQKRVANRPLPEVEVVDMTTEAKMGSLPILSRALGDALCETVGRGEQTILFLNRRGFAVYVQCLGCGHVERCPNCDVALTFHRAERTLRCHHCDHSAPVIEACPECDGWMIGFSGVGTEKVESEVAQFLEKRGLGQTAILRLDRDTTTRKGSHGKILGEFRQGKAQILIGTQMVTKGLDFPNVTLVGVIAADSALNMPDFRAAERTFQLLAQVAGRAGRGEQPGRVLVQTLDPSHYAIEAARTHDYDLFIKQEMEFRATPPYPPFAHIANIISHDEDQNAARLRIEKLAASFHGAISKLGGGTELLGPVECPLARVKNRFRFHLMLRDRNRPRLHKVLRVYDNLPRDERAGLIVDVDAMALL